jgi:hypothetical protein
MSKINVTVNVVTIDEAIAALEDITVISEWDLEEGALSEVEDTEALTPEEYTALMDEEREYLEGEGIYTNGYTAGYTIAQGAIEAEVIVEAWCHGYFSGSKVSIGLSSSRGQRGYEYMVAEVSSSDLTEVMKAIGLLITKVDRAVRDDAIAAGPDAIDAQRLIDIIRGEVYEITGYHADRETARIVREITAGL